MADSVKPKYRVLVGIDWYDGNRAEPGEVRDDIPKKSLSWLLEQGVIEEYDPDKPWPPVEPEVET